jgi:putative oxidoreductase
MTGTSATRLIIPALGPLYERLAPLSYPLIRFVTGATLVPHGAQKLFGGDLAGMAQGFSAMGLEPALPLVYLVMITEFFGGICIALGFLTRPVAVAVVIFMAVAVTKVHWPHGYFWTNGGFEYPLLWGLVALAIAFRGGGALSVDRAIGREF